MDTINVAIPVPKRGAQRQREYRQALADRKYLEKPFTSWDGEGVTLADGSHIYTLLARHGGQFIENANGLSTETILQWLYKNGNPADINVIYGAGYDWNMWLKDLPRTLAKKIYEEKTITYRGWRLTWMQGRMFTLKPKNGQALVFYDVLPFFQRSFVAACDEYLGDRFIERENIVRNKSRRSEFANESAEDIRKYNDAELDNLKLLMEEFRQRCFDAGLPKLSRWYGPGALAAAVLKAEGVKDHLERHPEPVNLAIRRAYFGGRFEVIQTGHTSNPCYEYDINSAYPWGLLDVPSLAGGEWVNHEGDVRGLGTFTVYHVLYESAPGHKPQPFPARDGKTSNVAYPRKVEGWYWSPEVNVAREYVRLHGGSLDIVESWELRPATDVKPFAFVREYYNKRKALKKAGDGAHVSLKLALNSLYGKTAQQVGWRLDDETGEPILPPFHCLEWAGYITSKCRAAVMRAVLNNLDAVIAWETDAVFTTRKLKIDTGTGLGQWEYSEFPEGLTYLQSGTYFSGEDTAKSRGVDRGELVHSIVAEALITDARSVSAKLTRFITLGTALQGRNSFVKWCRWMVQTKEVRLTPPGKRVHMHESCKPCREHKGLWDGLHETRIPVWAREMVSAPFTIEWDADTDTEIAAALGGLRDAGYEADEPDDY